MHGTKNTPELPTYGNKVIAVMDGNLEMHGKKKTSWTTLHETAEAYEKNADGTIKLDADGAIVYTDNKSIYLDIDVSSAEHGWLVGDKVVIASTSFEASEYDLLEIESFGTWNAGTERL
jgi:hypothetical protein